MRKFAILAFLLLANAAGLAAQGGGNGDPAGGAGPVHTESLGFKGFTGICNKGNVEVIYTAGGEYSVILEESGAARSTVRLEEGTITVSCPGDAGKCSTTLRVTAPALETLENYGNMQLTCGGKQPGVLEIENYGNMSFAADSLSADSMTLENNGNIKAKVTEPGVRGLGVENNGSMKLETVVKINTLVIENNGMLDGRLTAEAQTLELGNNGLCTLEAVYKGGKATITNRGNSKLSLDVDCATLNAANSGLSEMAFSGTADSVRIDGAGRSHVDVSQLNNF